MAIIGAEENDDNKTLVKVIRLYVKGHQKRKWLADIFDSDDMTIKTLDVDYEDIESLNNLDITKLCDVENILRIMRYRMYLKCTTDGRNVKKNCINFEKIKCEIFLNTF